VFTVATLQLGTIVDKLVQQINELKEGIQRLSF